MRLLFSARIALTLILSLLGFCSMAQNFPSKPVTIVVPFPAGGALDTVARAIAEQMRVDLGQAVIVDNKAGAGGTVGSALVARAMPDGHTILLGSVATHAIAAGIYPKLAYDPVGDFVPITQLTSSPLVLTVSPKFSVANVNELIAHAKSRPGKVNFASTGNGTALHIAGEVFSMAAGINVIHIPYKGGPQATTALLASEVDYILANPQLVMALIQSGKLQSLAVTGKQRLTNLPMVPTLNEAGVAGVDVTTWFGLWAPKNTPMPIVERINASARKALASAEVRHKLEGQGDLPVGSSVEEFATFARAEYKYWLSFVQSAGIKLQ
ncbi:MAG: Bug family tripartite tricarboxylate transporter substrate binding protein [Hylemonella sp.]